MGFFVGFFLASVVVVVVIVSGTSQTLILSIAQVNANSYEIPRVILEGFWTYFQTSDEKSGTEHGVIDSNLSRFYRI